MGETMGRKYGIYKNILFILNKSFLKCKLFI